MEDTQSVDDSLRSRLAAVLPEGYTFGIHHISTPPTKTDALYSSPPGERPDRTYCEKHFLAVSVDAGGPSEASQEEPRRQVLVLGVEIFLYTTSRSTTLFVSKADSTGFLRVLDLPPGTPSPIREVCATLIRYLVEQRRRRDVDMVVSLFARAQDQYLFPGSIKHEGKHVLDDRGLVKWWCRVLDPLIESPPTNRAGSGSGWRNAKGYLLVPGLDAHETRAFVPRGERWAVTHPLERISHYSREFDWVPPRCLIPRFPDDPKSRFRDELDGESSRNAMRTTGSWRTVKTLDTFWDMMAFRQECSSGRMTGFIWVVFDNKEDEGGVAREKEAPETPKTQRIVNISPATTPKRLFARSDTEGDEHGRKGGAMNGRMTSGRKSTRRRRKKKNKKLRGIIVPRQPRIKTKQRNYLLERPVSTAYYYWPGEGRGERIVDEADYKRMLELLLHLDFATMDKAVGSTRRWVSEVGLGSRWGYDVVGTRGITGDGGVVKRKRAETAGGEQTEHVSKVNVLSAGLVRRKAKT